MRTAAGLHGGDLHRVGDVADVEDPHALEPRPHGRVRAAVDAGAGLLHRHEQQVPVDRQVALAPRAHHVGDVHGSGRIGHVVDVEPVEVAHEGVVAPEGEVGGHEREAAGVGGVDEARRLVVVGTLLEVADRRLGVEPAGIEIVPGVVARLGACAGGGEAPGDQGGGRRQPDQPCPATTSDITSHLSGLPRVRRPPRPAIRTLECGARLRTVVRRRDLGDESSGSGAVRQPVRPTGQETPVPPRPQ